jgi:anti-sigma factor RsiW
VITINATISRRRGDPDLNLDNARRGRVDRTLAPDRAIGVRADDDPDVDLEALLDDVDLDGVVPDRPCDLLLAVLRRRASAPVWARVVAATPWVRVADFTALLR